MGKMFDAVKHAFCTAGAVLGIAALGTASAGTVDTAPQNGGIRVEDGQDSLDVFDPVTRKRHFEAHGDRWAVFAEKGREGECMAKAMGWILDQKELDVLSTPLDKVLLLVPKGREAAPGCIMRVSEEGEMHMDSVFPVLKGLPNEMHCRYAYRWQRTGGAEADLFFAFEGGPHVSLYDPFFLLDAESFKQDAPVTMEVAAWAYSARKATEDSHILSPDSGAYKDLRRMYPDTVEEIRISLKGIRAMLSREYASEFNFRVPVEGVEKIMCADWPMYRITTTLVGEGEGLRAYLYVAEHLLGDYIPQVGDDLEGRYWLTGHLKRAE